MPDNISRHNAALSAQERSERGRKAGKRSGEIRRENRDIKERIHDRLTADDLTEIIDNLIDRAKRSTRDFEILRDTIGEKPTNRVTIDSDTIEIRVDLADD